LFSGMQLLLQKPPNLTGTILGNLKSLL